VARTLAGVLATTVVAAVALSATGAATQASAVTPGSTAGAAPSSASASAGTSPASPNIIDLAGGGRGLTGPASRALVNSFAAVDAAPDGTLLVQDHLALMRVDPVADSVSVMSWPTPSGAFGAGDVAADGPDVILRANEGVVRVGPGGTVSTVWGQAGVGSLDVGADHVVWALAGGRVHRILPDGSSSAVTAAGALVEPIDLTVSPDGSAAYVLDVGSTHRGIYRVTASGLGARVAGNGGDVGQFAAGLSPTDVTTVDVRSISTDGAALAMSSSSREVVLSFPLAGGLLTQVAGGPCSNGVAHLGSALVVECLSEPGRSSLHRFTGGTDMGRVMGIDPSQPWSPDAVRATDAYLGAVRGAAGGPDGRVVFTTEHGLVREVSPTGLLRTRAVLPSLAAGRGRVALAADGTAYVTTGTGSVTAVSADGVVTPVTADAVASDVEVLGDGSLAIADAAAHRVVRVLPGGATTVLTSAIGTPVDLARDGASLLVADGGLRRVPATGGTVATVLSGGGPTRVTATGDGPWANPDTGVAPFLVISADGSMQPVAGLEGDVAQLQAVGDGSVLRAGGETLSRILRAGAGQPVPAMGVTATAGEGRITLAWDRPNADVALVARKGGTAPRDLWDGVRVPVTGRGGEAVMLVGGTPLTPGEQWSFSLFEHGYTTNEAGNALAWGPASSASAAALPDTTAPAVVGDVQLTADQRQISLGFSDPRDDDFDHSVVRYALGSTPPATVTDGLAFPREYPSGWNYGTIPNPVRDQDYAVTIFALDHQGNTSSWSAVTRLDVTPPGQVTGVSVTPSFRRIAFSFTAPTDADYTGIRYAVVPAGQAPGLTAAESTGGTSVLTPDTLTTDTDYTLALWSVDRAGNVSEPVLTPFRTLLDSTPPATPGALAAQGGAYAVAATWVPPTDADLASQKAVLTDLDTGKATTASPVTKTSSSFTWTKQPGGHRFRVDVVATDVNGLTSSVASAEATTDPDTNGPPPAVPLSSITVTPASTTSVAISFPRPDIPDLKALAYDVRPVGSDPDPVGTLLALPLSSATVKATVTLPAANTASELVIYVWDHNGNRVRTVVPSVKGAPSTAELPLAPTSLAVSSPRDNTLEVSWAKNTSSVAVSQWRVTATSGTLTHTAVVDGAARQARLTALPGRVSWQVSVLGIGTWGSGPAATSPAVAVGDTTAPQPVTAAKRVSSYDTDTLTWTNPLDVDLDHVDVVRTGATAAETTLVYRGKGTSARSTGLVAGRSYTYLLRTYDAFGQTWSSSVRLDTLRAAPSLTGSTTLRYGSTAKLSGVLRFNGSVLPGRPVILFSQRYGTSTWSTASTTTTTSTGGYAFTVKPSTSTRYRVGYLGSGSAGGAYSPTASVPVAPTVTMTASRTSLYYGGYVTFSTVVRPGHAGRSVSLQRWNGSAWKTVTTRTLSSTSTASAKVRPPARGTNKYRWVLAAHTDHATGVSATSTVRVY
jgi:hypothetical protein